MTWTADDGHIFQLCMLDTNAMSEILKYPEREGHFFTKNFPPDNYAPCFSLYNVIEIKQHPELYQKFISFFSIYPCFMLKLPFDILDDEIDSYDSGNPVTPLFHAFSMLGKGESYDIAKFFGNLFQTSDMQALEASQGPAHAQILDGWIKSSKDFSVTKEFPNGADGARYVKEMILGSLYNRNQAFVEKLISNGEKIDHKRFPCLKTMLYSQYYRLFDPSWKPNVGEINDIFIFAATPYVDVIITEKFQINIFNKIRGFVPGLAETKFYRLKDIRK